MIYVPEVEFVRSYSCPSGRVRTEAIVGRKGGGKAVVKGRRRGGGALRLQNTEVRFKLKITRMGSFKIITVKQRREFSKYK